MRILIVCGGAQITGGAEKIALTSALGLAKRGHRVRVIAIHGPIGEELKLVPNLEVTVINPEPRKEGRDLLERTRLIWPEGIGQAMKLEFDHAQADPETVLHFHCGYLELGIPGFRALAHSGIPTVYTHHDYTWACPLMGFYDYTRKQTCGLRGGSLACLTTDCTERYLEKLVRYTRHFGTHQTSGIRRHVAQHLFVSETNRAKLLPYLPADAVSRVLYNATEAPRNPRRPSGEASDLIFLGRLTDEKDPLALAVAARNVGMSAKFIGDGPLRPKMEEAGFGNQLLGWKSAAEVAAILGGAKALGWTSRCVENAPLVIPEAAAMGVPTVGPSDTSAAEFIHHECTGLIYDRSQPDALERALERLKDVAFANFLGAEAYRQYWDNPPTLNRHLDELESVYKEVLKR